MEFFRFDKAVGKSITAYDSTFIMSRIIRTTQQAHIGCMHLESNGVVGYHQARIPQLLLVVNGEGWVRGGDDNKIPVRAGDAVFWTEGEWHETTTESGLTAIVIESEELQPDSFMTQK